MSAGQSVRRRQRGFGLVEMMVAMVLGLLLVSAAIQVFLSTRASQQYNQALSEVQDSARFAMHVLTRDLRLAGYTGCASGLVNPVPSVVSNSSYGVIRVISQAAVDRGITADNLLADSIAESDDELPGSADGDSDALRLAYMRDYGVRVTETAASVNANIKINANPAGWEAGDELLVTDCRQADLFTATNVSQSAGTLTIAHASNANTDNNLSKVYDERARVLEPYATVYYIREDDGGLHRKEYFAETDATSTFEELVEGISALTVRYGVDTDADRAPEIYRTGAQVEAANQWSDVVAVRIGFVARSDTRVGNDANTDTLDILGRNVNPPDDNRLRRVFTTTIALRNRVP